MAIQIWTDGSCYYADRAGAWAFVAALNNEIIDEDLGAVPDTTSARMEMTAVLEAIKFANRNYKGVEIEIVTDYATVVNCFKERWYLRWIEMNWYDVKNSDLWKLMLTEIFSKVNKFKFVKVKGHTGVELNERADFLAGEGRKYCIEKYLK